MLRKSAPIPLSARPLPSTNPHAILQDLDEEDNNNDKERKGIDMQNEVKDSTNSEKRNNKIDSISTNSLDSIIKARKTKDSEHETKETEIEKEGMLKKLHHSELHISSCVKRLMILSMQ